ncbi:hypothetical protein O6H91_09G037000 [Diphasiastrum complanatum]|uniref:Uncharacterized protein n=1 Tax=Diphasiastrum complanatum TaxID=34168 RepID=A0ACC2CN64_DIPCM|nr:hypothetical protein O6H91_09G037000 [Diphasiastrum complanatum]
MDLLKTSLYFKSVSQLSPLLCKNPVYGVNLTARNLVCRSARCSLVLPAMRPTSSSVSVMVNDCSGKVGHAVATAIFEAGLQLVPSSLTGPGRGGRHVTVGNVDVHMHDTSEKHVVLDMVLSQYPEVVVVDYTLPDAVNGNAEFYCERRLPFVMGTTGGDRDKLTEVVHKYGNYAVIAPQMGKQVVAFQATLEIMAEQFPGAFAGYTLHVVESHQSSKVDTSGTAKAIVSSFRRLGIAFDDNEGLFPVST